MDLAKLFSAHIASLQQTYERAMTTLAEREGGPEIEAILIHSGSEHHYYADDRGIPFEAFGHFKHWLPLNRPDQMVLIQPGEKPTYYQVVPSDFWYEQGVARADWWADRFEIVALEKQGEVFDHLPETRRIAFLGEETGFAAELGLPRQLVNHRALRDYLDFYRAVKSDYEVAMMREANRLGMICHQAALEAFQRGASEYEIHLAFLGADQMIEHDSPYTNIVALDEKGAILHYQNKRRASGADSKVLLIDAGCRVNGYASDITRTHVRDGVHPVFRSLLEGMERLELDLVGRARVGAAYAEIHFAAHDGVLDLLMRHEIVKDDRDALEEHYVSKLFFPHGIGHLLGLQVHDVAGHIADDAGTPAPPPINHAWLRLNREMREGMVFTIEPGLYFIPVLLEPERETERGKLLNWDLIETLTPLGGVRIEDNILVTADGPVNLTRG